MKSPLKSSKNSLMKSKLTPTTWTLNIIAIPYYLFYFFLFKWMFSRVCIFLTDILEMKISNVGPSHIHETKINFEMIEHHLSDTRHLLYNHIIHQNILKIIHLPQLDIAPWKNFYFTSPSFNQNNLDCCNCITLHYGLRKQLRGKKKKIILLKINKIFILLFHFWK
jgi:hypothetical protein